MPTLTMLVSFNGTNGNGPTAGLIIDAAGDLLGTTAGGGAGANAQGTVFEITKTDTGYASTPTTLVIFNGIQLFSTAPVIFPNGAGPLAGVIADATGDLFGTTLDGGAIGDGTVFEIPYINGSYASTPTILASFDGSSGGDGGEPFSGLIADAAGDLFGTTNIGGLGGGTVFEIAKTAGGYASMPTVLTSFGSGGNPYAGLVADSAGNLFGTTQDGGAVDGGTVFEIAKTSAGYASTATTLVSFTGFPLLNNGTGNGEDPQGGLIVDAAEDLFGTTEGGGAYGDGTVFEIAKTSTVYASAPTTLVTFDGADGNGPAGALIADAAGDLFGTTQTGGANNDGTVFEILKTSTGYAGTPITLFSFSGTNGSDPDGTLIADAAGDLFGTTFEGGASNDGTVFELSDTGFQVTPPYSDFYGTGTSDILWQNSSTDQAAIWEMSGGAPTAYSIIGGVPSGWQVAGSGDFNGDGMADILWQNQSSGQAAIWLMNGASATSYNTIDAIPSGWQVAGVGDFNSDGDADILWRNPATTQIAVWEMNAATPTSETIIGTAPSAWKVGGVADFNSDGDADILWQNSSTGQIAIWEMNGASVSAYDTIGTAPSGWQIAGTGDFAGNGTQDILFQNTSTDQLAVWETNGASLTDAAIIANGVPFSSGWQIAAVGDYTGSGADSILWQNSSTGQAALWQTNGSSLTSTSIIASGIASGWTVAHNPVLAA